MKTFIPRDARKVKAIRFDGDKERLEKTLESEWLILDEDGIKMFSRTVVKPGEWVVIDAGRVISVENDLFEVLYEPEDIMEADLERVMNNALNDLIHESFTGKRPDSVSILKDKPEVWEEGQQWVTEYGSVFTVRAVQSDGSACLSLGNSRTTRRLENIPTYWECIKAPSDLRITYRTRRFKDGEQVGWNPPAVLVTRTTDPEWIISSLVGPRGEIVKVQKLIPDPSHA